MTSSLVGSEMCIRDSGFLNESDIYAMFEHPKLQLSPSSGNFRRGDVAVSYTHLTLPTICSV
eukprot:5014045-Prorocentrum_lima.AAC.1